ncbi:cutinase family protein [Nocardia sp. CNY236]|uniref:cutinase family protein n=1 Tax=Nocardia sp. CNY236 TaxID=1169152 RepID=UPI000404E864|nr:cutinase family protein [Nocardia sp. CNY236]
MTGLWRRSVVAVIAVAVGAVMAATQNAAAQPTSTQGCPVLLVIGVQPIEQASADTAADTDSGMLGQLFRPLLTKAGGGSVQRLYVRVGSPARAANPSAAGDVPYDQIISAGVSELSQTAREFLSRCPRGQLAVAGDGQGAQVAAQFAQQVGAGSSTVPADRVAGIAVFGDPSRSASATLFPGRPGKTVPDAAPGTPGERVGRIQAMSQKPLTGRGIGSQRGAAVDFGALAGRVASFCIAGDLACDAPERAPILQVVANISSAADQSGGDPLRALASVTQALAFTAIKTATNVVNHDIKGNSLASLSLSSRTSLSGRVAEASDPNTPLDIDAVLKAVLKVGTIALNSVVTVAKSVITPANIAEIAAAGLANPAAGMAVLGQKLLGAIPELIPPTTASRLVNQAFEALVSNVADNAGLVETAAGVKYSDVITRRGAYTTNPVGADGATPVQFTADWFTAIVHDLAAAHPEAVSNASGSSSAPSTTASNSRPSAIVAPTTSRTRSEGESFGSSPTRSPTPQ